jgi:hypothetical protein
LRNGDQVFLVLFIVISIDKDSLCSIMSI